MLHFFEAIEEGYPDANPYHNRAHGASVLHMTHALMRHGGAAAAVGQGRWFDGAAPVPGAALGTAPAAAPAGALETLACLLAAAVHDYEHLGLTNGYLVKTRHPRAVVYNDAHVNESHHAAAAFQVNEGCLAGICFCVPRSRHAARRRPGGQGGTG